MPIFRFHFALFTFCTFYFALHLKKVCYKVSLCENRERQSFKAFIGLSVRTKMIGGERPLLRENLTNTNSPPFKMPIFAPRTSAVTVYNKMLSYRRETALQGAL